tara:strand:- start:19832 stop:20362 length:531 start_codon:yes stop_codon:yes gene_type:complete
MKTIALFCGARSGTAEHAKTANEFIDWMKSNKYSLVYGGGSTGIMGSVSNALIKNGSKVIGVIPHFLYDWEVGNDDCTELIKVISMHERKKIMFDRADAFVVLPGGFGTLDEICEMITWKQLKTHNKPIAFLNSSGYFDKFFEFIEYGVKAEYISDIDLTRIQKLTDMNQFNWEIV